MKLTKIDEAMISRGWIPVALAAEKMGIHESTAYRLIDDGTLEVAESAGKKYVSHKSCVRHLGPIAAKALGLT